MRYYLACGGRLEGNVAELGLSSYNTGAGDWTQAIKIGSGYLYLSGHLTSPYNTLSNLNFDLQNFIHENGMRIIFTTSSPISPMLPSLPLKFMTSLYYKF